MFVNKKHEEAHETMKSGAIDKAIVLFTEVLSEHPNAVDVISDRGVAYLHQGNQALCMADLDKALSLQPDYAYRYACRAFAKNHFKDLQGAIEDYQKAVELDPSDAVAHNNLGLLLEQKGYQKESQDLFKRADALSKQEDELYKVMDGLEEQEEASKSKSVEEQEEQEETSKSKSVEELEEQEEREEITNTATAFEEAKKVFTSRQQFKEFIQFIKNGFKLK